MKQALPLAQTLRMWLPRPRVTRNRSPVQAVASHGARTSLGRTPRQGRDRPRGQCRAAPCDPPSPDLGSFLPRAQAPAETRFGTTGAAAPVSAFAEAGAVRGVGWKPGPMRRRGAGPRGGPEGPTRIPPDAPGPRRAGEPSAPAQPHPGARGTSAPGRRLRGGGKGRPVSGAFAGAGAHPGGGAGRRRKGRAETDQGGSLSRGRTRGPPRRARPVDPRDDLELEGPTH